MVRQLQPWHQNVAKRQVKSPKIYLRDTGVLHTLLSIPDRRTLLAHPKAGASWEGLALEQVLSLIRPADAYFWATHGGAELDLLCRVGGRAHGFEFKLNESPTATRSMHVVVEDLRLDHLWVVHPGSQAYRLSERITAWPLADLAELPDRMGRTPT